MRTCKLIDTCTLINLFCEGGPEVSSPLSDYEVIVSNTVVEEYTRKYPRVVPDFITIVQINDDDKSLMDDLELLMPRIGAGERSIYAIMVRMSKDYDKIVMLTDDQDATKKLGGYMQNDGMLAADTQVIWGDTTDLINKFISEGKIKN